MSGARILIIGAGLCGLTSAIALARAGFAVEVHEQAAVLGEVGAGLTVSRGAQKVFDALGLTPALRAKASITPSMAFLHYRTGALLYGGYDHGDGTLDDGAPSGLHIHRADLHEILATAYKQTGGALFLGHKLIDLDDTGTHVRAVFADGTTAESDILVGTDGLRSIVRRSLWGDGEPRFTGQVAYRCLVPRDLAAPYMSAGRAAVYFGPDRVFNRYSLRAGEVVNCAAITRGDWQGEGWTNPASPEELAALYEGWHPDVTGLMRQAPREHLIKWALFDREPLPRWRQGNISLAGDAAHPMLPFLGLGAAMAIEDAMVLARALIAEPGIAGLDRYEAVRLPRTSDVMRLSRLQGDLVQARDPDHYEPGKAPAHDPTLHDFDPVTCPIEV